jgi:shikimate dehydrogenase
MPGTRLGVTGWPVGHSRSPQIHNAALHAVGLDEWRYQLLPLPPALLAETLRALPQLGFRGVNVTIPHKQAALALAGASSSQAANEIGAANALIFEADGQIRAENTDAPALIDALPLSPSGKRALVLGAGGSARAAVWALHRAGVAEIMVWNRTPERARRLAEQLGATPTARAQPADLLINCTSVGLAAASDQFKQLPLNADEIGMFGCVVDLVYRQGDTALVRAARERAIPAIDGLALLVGQAALSFELFTGRSAPHDVMREALGER